MATIETSFGNSDVPNSSILVKLELNRPNGSHVNLSDAQVQEVVGRLLESLTIQSLLYNSIAVQIGSISVTLGHTI